MIAQNESQNLIALLTMKGTIMVYKILNPDFPTINSLKLEYEVSIARIIQSQNFES